MTAVVVPGPPFRVVSRSMMFADSYIYAGNPHANYDVTPDGAHFVFLKSTAEGELTVVTNWHAELRARMAGAER